MSAHPAFALPADRFATVQMCAGDLQESLYRAALGPLNVQHYLAAFERLDAAGRVLPGWNWAAAMGTLAWMAFRGLWPALVLYASGLALLLLLALWALAQAGGAIPAPVLGGLALAGLLPAGALPGLYGDALVHRHARRRIDAALASQPTIADAIARLQRQAPSRAGLAWLVAAGLAVLAALAAAAWLRLEGTGAGEDAAVAAAAAPAAAPAPVARPEQPSEPPASQALSALPGQAPADSSPPAEPPPPARAEPTPAAPAATPVAAAVSVPVPASASASALASAPAPAPAPAATAAADEAHAPLAQARRLYVNVGLFAQPANAQRAHAQLLRAGLPSAVREITAADGRRLRRVRVGPFASAGEANAAAAQVRALGLDAAAASSD